MSTLNRPFSDYVEVTVTKIVAVAAQNTPGVLRGVQERPGGPEMLRLMLQSGLYYRKLFLNSKSAAYKWERLKIESGLWWRAYGSDCDGFYDFSYFIINSYFRTITILVQDMDKFHFNQSFDALGHPHFLCYMTFVFLLYIVILMLFMIFLIA